MDHGILINRFLTIQTAAENVGINLEVNPETNAFILSGMGPNQDQSRSYMTIQELGIFADGFALGFNHPRT